MGTQAIPSPKETCEQQRSNKKIFEQLNGDKGGGTAAGRAWGDETEGPMAPQGGTVRRYGTGLIDEFDRQVL